MRSSESREQLALMAIGVLVLLGPVLILFATLEVLILFGDLEFNQLTLVEFLELYIIDLVLFVGLAYGIYRLTLWLVRNQVPPSLNSHDENTSDDSD